MAAAHSPSGAAVRPRGVQPTPRPGDGALGWTEPQTNCCMPLSWLSGIQLSLGPSRPLHSGTQASAALGSVAHPAKPTPAEGQQSVAAHRDRWEDLVTADAATLTPMMVLIPIMASGPTHSSTSPGRQSVRCAPFPGHLAHDHHVWLPLAASLGGSLAGRDALETRGGQ